MSWPLFRMASSLLIALAVALSVNGRLRCFRISTHPCQASKGIQSGTPFISLVVNWCIIDVLGERGSGVGRTSFRGGVNVGQG
jgi:hypothetical protein